MDKFFQLYRIRLPLCTTCTPVSMAGGYTFSTPVTCEESSDSELEGLRCLLILAREVLDREQEIESIIENT